MKTRLFNGKFAIAILLFLNFTSTSIQSQNRETKKNLVQKETISKNQGGKGLIVTIEFTKGKSHNHPSFAIWVEDLEGNFMQNLYVTKSVATGIFNYGDNSTGQWSQGEVRRPAALPYWVHKQGILSEDSLYMPNPEHPVPDAYTGATPTNDFVLETKLDQPGLDKFNVPFEINQPWDWNDYWANSKYPDDEDYKSSSQPAVVYMATVDLNSGQKEYEMKLIGHSHYSGKDGKLYKDTSTLSTALDIAGKIVVKIK